jgi:hypothetical protein
VQISLHSRTAAQEARGHLAPRAYMAHRNSPLRSKVPGNLTYFIAVVDAGWFHFSCTLIS